MSKSKRRPAAAITVEREVLRAQPHPSKPLVDVLGPNDVSVRWDMPTGTAEVSGFCVRTQKGGARGAWEVVVPDTASPVCTAHVTSLVASTWYQCRVTPIFAAFGHGFGSIQSEPFKTLPENNRTLLLEKLAAERSRDAALPVSTGQTAAAALVVARGADTTPPPTEEESAYYDAAASQSLKVARLRKLVIEWDTRFESTHGCVGEKITHDALLLICAHVRFPCRQSSCHK